MRRRLRYISVGLGIVALALVVGMISFRLSHYLELAQDFTIRFVVPNGYRGVFMIKLDAAHGNPPPKLTRGVREIDVPPSGIVVFNDVDFFGYWHREEVLYSDGTPLQCDSGDSICTAPDANDRVLFRELGGFTAPENEMFILIGTAPEKEHLLKMSLRDQVEAMREEIAARNSQ